MQMKEKSKQNVLRTCIIWIILSIFLINFSKLYGILDIELYILLGGYSLCIAILIEIFITVNKEEVETEFSTQL